MPLDGTHARPDQGGPALPPARRPHPGVDRARRRRHRPAHRGARARRQPARRTGRCSRWPTTATSRSTGCSSRRISGSPARASSGPISAHRASPRSRRARASRPSGRRARRRTSSASRSIPGAVVTFVAELRTPDLPQLYLWDADAYKDSVNSYTLYRGIVLGISGLLALFLTIVFVVKGTAMFPATAALAWAVLIYLCIDFGFWNRVIDVAPGDDQMWRAGAEVFLAASLRHLHLHLPQPQPLARPLQPPDHRLADRPGDPARRRGHRAVGRRRASRASRSA